MCGNSLICEGLGYREVLGPICMTLNSEKWVFILAELKLKSPQWFRENTNQGVHSSKEAGTRSRKPYSTAEPGTTWQRKEANWGLMIWGEFVGNEMLKEYRHNHSTITHSFVYKCCQEANQAQRRDTEEGTEENKWRAYLLLLCMPHLSHCYLHCMESQNTSKAGLKSSARIEKVCHHTQWMSHWLSTFCPQKFQKWKKTEIPQTNKHMWASLTLYTEFDR